MKIFTWKNFFIAACSASIIINIVGFIYYFSKNDYEYAWSRVLWILVLVLLLVKETKNNKS